MKPKKSRLLCSSRTKSIGKGVSKMTKSVAYIGVVVLVVGVLLTTCVGSAWSMTLLTDEQMTVVRGTDCPELACPWSDCGQDPQGCCMVGVDPGCNAYGCPPFYDDCQSKVLGLWRRCTGGDQLYDCSNTGSRYPCISYSGGEDAPPHGCTCGTPCDGTYEWGCP